MLRILESQAPAKQNATDTINTLSSRLQNANLLEDRRAAILGLRSFAKLYPASVASGALRDLIASLRNDGEDTDTTKVVLETLLMLFTPDEKSAEASGEISLWLADEFTQRQDNITMLLDLLESRDFYLRLYTLQLISHVSTARPERTQECIFSAPLGVSRLAAVLDDKRDAIRNEALILLTALTPSSTELQKVVAFENAFERIFAVIESEGSLTHGSTTVQDCLSLLANLLKLNVSNQSYFREIGCVTKLSKLLVQVTEEEESADGASEWVKPQRDLNIWGLLSIIQLFLVQGGQGTPLNQSTFWQSGIIVQILRLAFRQDLNVSVRAKCLSTCADLIRGNASLQEQFGDLSVPKSRTTKRKEVNGHAKANVEQPTNVIEALLKLALEPASGSLFDVRLASCECVKAFFSGHEGICIHILRRAIDGFKSGDDDVPNILTVLIRPPDSRRTIDPYQTWMASVLLFHLVFDRPEVKRLGLTVSDGDASSGEEVITCIQAISGNLVAGWQKVEDERILIGYLMLLCGWVFEDPDAVNDFCGEASNVQSLINACKMTGQISPLVSGLCAMLLGELYEFSSKDSLISRSTLHKLLTTGLGRERYIDKMTKLRENGYIRDFEVLSQSTQATADGGLPEVFFDKTFIDFLKDNFSRLLRAIDRDPGLEISIVANGVQKGISRELVDTLRAQMENKTKIAADLESQLLLLMRKLEQEELDHRKSKDSAAVEVSRIKQINESLQSNHEDELHQLNRRHEQNLTAFKQQWEDRLRDMGTHMKQTYAESERNLSSVRERYEEEVAGLKNIIQTLEGKLAKAERNHLQDLQTAHEEYSMKIRAIESASSRLESKVQDAEERAHRAMRHLEVERATVRDLQSHVKAKEDVRQGVQMELDDLLIVFADLEAKRAEDKKRLKLLGEPVSEGEDDEDTDMKGSDDEPEDGDLD